MILTECFCFTFVMGLIWDEAADEDEGVAKVLNLIPICFTRRAACC